MSHRYDWIYFWALTDWRPIKPPEPTKCDRCGITVDPDYFYKSKTWLFPYKIPECPGYGSEYGEKVVWVCYQCDWELMNEWAPYEETHYELWRRRERELAERDPVNFGHLLWGGF